MSASNCGGAISPVPDDVVIVDDKIRNQPLPTEFLRQGTLPNCTFLLSPSDKPLEIEEIFRRTFNALDVARVSTDRRTSVAVKFIREPRDFDAEDEPIRGNLEFHHKILPDLTIREKVNNALADTIGESFDTVAEKASAVAINAVKHACSKPTPADVGASFCGGAPVISGVPRFVSWGVEMIIATALSPTAGALTLGAASIISYTTTEENPSSPPPVAQKDS